LKLQENIGKKLLAIGLCNGILDKSPKAQAKKAKINKQTTSNLKAAAQ
jgi:hypothetical protein